MKTRSLSEKNTGWARSHVMYKQILKNTTDKSGEILDEK